MRPEHSRKLKVQSMAVPVEESGGRIVLEIVVDKKIRRQLARGRRIDIDVFLQTDAENVAIDGTYK
jgi:hypothetical protein